MMEICLEKSGKLLKVLFSDAELAEKQRNGGLFRRRYGCSRGVTFTFEKSEKGFFLYVSFDRYKDLGVLTQITNGQPVEELQLLSELARLPRAKMYGSNVPLLDGRNVDLIDTVRFELRKIGDGVWEAGGTESEVDRLNRQMRLNRLKDGLPGIYIEWNPDTLVASQAESARSEVIFADKVTEIETGAQREETCRTEKDSTSERTLGPKEQKDAASERALEPKKRPIDPVQEGEQKVSAPSPAAERDPDEIAECDRCERLFYEDELTETRLRLFLCKYCRISPALAKELGLTPDELLGIGSKTCSECGVRVNEEEMTEVRPGVFLCNICHERRREFKKPTAKDINDAIQLLLWRCRDVQIHKDKPQGKRGFYRLDDWITKANDDMIRELGLWCADIQELNIGTRDS